MRPGVNDGFQQQLDWQFPKPVLSTTYLDTVYTFYLLFL